jgi:diguanylate cyclase (GGDEF)-like protein
LDGPQPKIIGTVQALPQHDQVTMMGVIQDITERKKLECQLEQQANTDFLTGCASRRHFLENAGHEVLRIRRYGGELSMLALDLDNFKTVNDQYGHQSGDLVLKKLAEVCRGMLRDVDLVGRLGGEEFAILLPETGGQLAFEVARRLCQAVATAEVPLSVHNSIHFTTSIGVASLLESDVGIETILNRADQALYKAKHEGRNRACA